MPSALRLFHYNIRSIVLFLKLLTPGGQFFYPFNKVNEPFSSISSHFAVVRCSFTISNKLKPYDNEKDIYNLYSGSCGYYEFK
jgi:hypothetical protein